MPRLQVEKVHGPARRRIVKGLLDYNARAAGKDKYRPLTITLRRGKDIVGGVTGSSWMGWLYVEVLWIADKFRGQGLGISLMKRAEAEARKRGVRNVYLNSFSFQAPGFYKKLGYREFGRLKNFPPGHTRIWMKKAL
jgi:GNAT superfamily N-acetyltransferase